MRWGAVGNVGLILLCCARAGAEGIVPRIERWELQTSLLTVRAVASDGHRLWAATSGGLFWYEPSTGVITAVRKTEGVLVHDFTALAADTVRGTLVAGAFDGTLEVGSPDGRWVHLTDIRNQPGIPEKRITALAVTGDTVYAGTAFGLVVFDLRRGGVLQFARRIGAFSPGIAVLALCLWRDSLWIGTAEGIAAAPRAAPALDYPLTWRAISSAEVRPPVRFLLPLDSVLVVGTETQLLLYRAGQFQLLRTFPQPLVGVARRGEEVWIATQSELWQEFPERQQQALPVRSPSGLWGVTLGAQPLLVVGAAEQGLWFWRAGQWQRLRPNTPHTNLLLRCAVDGEGTLWCATDRNAGRGFACRAGGVWYAFLTETHPQIGNNEYHTVLPASAGGAWLASWGKGVLWVRRVDTGFVFERYGVENTPLRGIPSDTTFLPIGGMGYDADGNLWAVCHWCVTGALLRRSPDGQVLPLFRSLPVPQRRNLSFARDPFGTVWLGSVFGDGLFYFRGEGGSENWGQLTTANSALPDNYVYALAVDHDGMLWVGTSGGVGVVLNPGAVLSGGQPIVRNVSLLRERVVYDIAVDVYNNKWLATDAGVWVVNPDATEVLLHLTADNSPLPSSRVRAVTIDHATGHVFFGTEEGMAVAITSARRPAPTYALECYPQPFVPERDGVLTIDGLAEQSIVRVLTLEGVAVARLQTQSRTAYWDGRNERGELVPAGVYVITAFSATTGEEAQAKVLLLRP